MELAETEQELVAAEAEYFATRVENPAARQIYTRMAEEAAQGQLSEEMLEPLGGLLEIGLSSGRIRAVHGAHAEMAARSLFRRTPQGKALHTQFAEVNRAFEVLRGQTIENLSLSVQGPGLYTLTVRTTQLELTASLKPSGVEVRTVEVSL